MRSVMAIVEKSIAVLPFENLSEDKGNAYFVAGMQDEILTALAKISDLKVISRTSTAKYNSHPDSLKTIAQELGVATILEGSVQKSGEAVHINVQLISGHDDAHVWAESYDRDLKNIFGVEREVAETVARQLKVKLLPREATERKCRLQILKHTTCISEANISTSNSGTRRWTAISQPSIFIVRQSRSIPVLHSLMPRSLTLS